MATNGILWVTPPARLSEGVRRYGQRAILAVRMVAEYISTKMMGEARQNAPWRDRTGNARSGLFAVVDVQGAAGDLVEIYLSHGHTIDYGVFLELARGGKYAIIMPTLEANLPEVRHMLDEIFA